MLRAIHRLVVEPPAEKMAVALAQTRLALRVEIQVLAPLAVTHRVLQAPPHQVRQVALIQAVLLHPGSQVAPAPGQPHQAVLPLAAVHQVETQAVQRQVASLADRHPEQVRPAVVIRQAHKHQVATLRAPQHQVLIRLVARHQAQPPAVPHLQGQLPARRRQAVEIKTAETVERLAQMISVHSTRR